MKKIAFTYGVISGSSMAIMYVLVCLTRNNANYVLSQMLMYAAVAILFFMVFTGINSYRKRVMDGFITFGQAFKAGILISLVSSLCYTIAWMILFNPFFKDFMEQHAATVMAQLKANGASSGIIIAKKEEMSRYIGFYKNPIFRPAIIFIQAFPAQTILTLIASLFLKRSSLLKEHQ